MRRNSIFFYPAAVLALMGCIAFVAVSVHPRVAALASGIQYPAYGTILNAGVPVAQRNNLNFTTGGCVDNAGTKTTDCTPAGGSGGSGIVVYSGAAPIAGTLFFPIGGGGLPSATESIAGTFAPGAATITNFYVNISAALGVGNTVVFTWRLNGASQSVTCTISGAVATSCSDITHSFAVAAGDTVAIQAVVTAGAVAGTPNLVMSVQFGVTSANGTVNTGAAHQTALYTALGSTVSGAGPGTTDQVWTSQGAAADPIFKGVLHSVTVVVDGGGSAIATGDTKTYPTADAAGTITRIDISADQSCSVTVDVWKAAGAIPTAGNIISAAAPLTLSAAQLAQNGSIAGWTTAVAVGDVFGFNVATVATCQRVIGQIWYR